MYWWMFEDGRLFLLVCVVCGVYQTDGGWAVRRQIGDKALLLYFYCASLVLVVVELTMAGILLNTQT